ncbi:MAG TPA: hypothetical protein VF763_04000 [Candidatus Limnocylindrales bacterium]
MVRWFLRVIVLRLVGRRLVPVLVAWDAYRLLQGRRRPSTSQRVEAARSVRHGRVVRPTRQTSPHDQD